jgi:hypothetical protein
MNVKGKEVSHSNLDFTTKQAGTHEQADVGLLACQGGSVP